MAAMQASKDWWKDLFDDVYLTTDARSVCDEDITRREVDLIFTRLPMRKTDRILDLCGGHGRHTLALAARGFTRCTLVDYSACLVRRARQAAIGHGYRIHCVRADARHTGLADDTFDHVLILGNSLGYIHDPTGDRQILDEARRLLRPGGWLLVDVTDAEKVVPTLTRRTWHEASNDWVVCRERRLNGQGLTTREIVLSKSTGIVRDQTYRIRLYDAKALDKLLTDAGFDGITVHRGFSPHQASGDYGFMNTRMVAVGRRPRP